MEDRIIKIIVGIALVCVVGGAIYWIANTDYEVSYTEGYIVDQQQVFTVRSRHVNTDNGGYWVNDVVPSYKTKVASDDGKIEFVSQSEYDFENYCIGQKVRIRITQMYHHEKYAGTQYSIE